MAQQTLRQFVKSHGHGALSSMARALSVSTQAVSILLQRVPSESYRPVYLKVMNNAFGTNYTMDEVPWIPEEKNTKLVDKNIRTNPQNDE